MKIRRSDDGYFTLEAALVLPFAFAVILIVIQIWFYKYDRVLQDMDTAAVVVRTIEQTDLSPEEKVAYAISEMQGRYKRAYIAWNFGDLSVRCSGNTVSCITTGSSGYSGGSFLFSVPSSLSAESSRSRTVADEVFVIRTYRKALGAAGAADAYLNGEER